MKKVILLTEMAQIDNENLCRYNTVEAEYGDRVLVGFGGGVTLAHHGSRSANPAPCIAKVKPNDLPIIVSHFDLDTLGGIMALWGLQREDDMGFWRVAAFIDCNGLHRLNDVKPTSGIENRIYAWQAYNTKHLLPRSESATDITDFVQQAIRKITLILDGDLDAIMDGQTWLMNYTKATESRLVQEDQNIRVFITDGTPCGTAYYSPKLDNVAKATISLNTKFNTISLAFEDGGKQFDAAKVVQGLWDGAGGRSGIAGSPRGKEMSRNDLDHLVCAVQKLYNA